MGSRVVTVIVPTVIVIVLLCVAGARAQAENKCKEGDSNCGKHPRETKKRLSHSCMYLMRVCAFLFLFNN